MIDTLSRRQFLGLSIPTALSVLLAACGVPATPSPVPTIRASETGTAPTAVPQENLKLAELGLQQFQEFYAQCKEYRTIGAQAGIALPFSLTPAIEQIYFLVDDAIAGNEKSSDAIQQLSKFKAAWTRSYEEFPSLSSARAQERLQGDNLTIRCHDFDDCTKVQADFIKFLTGLAVSWPTLVSILPPNISLNPGAEQSYDSQRAELNQGMYIDAFGNFLPFTNAFVHEFKHYLLTDNCWEELQKVMPLESYLSFLAAFQKNRTDLLRDFATWKTTEQVLAYNFGDYLVNGNISSHYMGREAIQKDVTDFNAIFASESESFAVPENRQQLLELLDRVSKLTVPTGSFSIEGTHNIAYDIVVEDSIRRMREFLDFYDSIVFTNVNVNQTDLLYNKEEQNKLYNLGVYKSVMLMSNSPEVLVSNERGKELIAPMIQRACDFLSHLLNGPLQTGQVTLPRNVNELSEVLSSNLALTIWASDKIFLELFYPRTDNSPVVSTEGYIIPYTQLTTALGAVLSPE